jgi:hypothetical protein
MVQGQTGGDDEGCWSRPTLGGSLETSQEEGHRPAQAPPRRPAATAAGIRRGKAEQPSPKGPLLACPHVRRPPPAMAGMI